MFVYHWFHKKKTRVNSIFLQASNQKRKKKQSDESKAIYTKCNDKNKSFVRKINLFSMYVIITTVPISCPMGYGIFGFPQPHLRFFAFQIAGVYYAWISPHLYNDSIGWPTFFLGISDVFNLFFSFMFSKWMALVVMDQCVVGHCTYAGLLYSSATPIRMHCYLCDEHFNYDNIFRRHLHLRWKMCWWFVNNNTTDEWNSRNMHHKWM